MVSSELPVLRIGGLFGMPAVGDSAVCLMLDDGLGAGFFLGSFYEGIAPAGPVLTGDLKVTGVIDGTLRGTVIDP
ncbi:hypothetical protein ACFSWD_28440 [Paenibacillus xanthanilyticus]